MNSVVNATRAGLDVLLASGKVYELRIPGTRRGTASGYYDDFDRLARDAERMSGQAAGIYLTLNPVDSELRARAYNHLTDYAKNTTTDNDILYRRWLPVDFDPDRPAGISSTDIEHEAAISRAREARDLLAALGFPAPILADSGNGAHLLYRIDLPKDDESTELVARCLNALDLRLTDSTVKVDTTTSNSARIWKVYGTLVCKGDNLPERPHRVARILELPGSVDVVPVDLLRTLADTAPRPADSVMRTSQNGTSRGADFDLDGWIADNRLPVVSQGAWQGGHKWVLNPCPWNQAHTNKAAYIVRFANGAIAAGCHHNGCKGKTWHDLRSLCEGERISRRGPHLDFNLSVPSAKEKEPPAEGPNPTQAEWPDPPGDAAFAGLAGRLVSSVEPHTEADPVAVLGNFLAAFGCAVGRGPHALVGATRHDARLFLALVGQSSKARKGDSWPPVRAVFEFADQEWAAQRTQSGLSSGEGLIAAVRDPIEKTKQVRNSPGEYEQVIEDAGVQDKRLLVIEPEFARVLQAMSRQGNTLNSIIRDAWDRGDLQSMTKTPLRATGVHVVITGHVTVEELRRELTATDAANGFANRFLWLAVKRSKLLPNPKPFAGQMVESLAVDVARVLEWARGVARMERDPDANELWEAIYPDLEAERDGLAAAVTARAAAQVLRLSLLYALLDRSEAVRVPHLQSALELWAYSERSALHIFGDATGDPVADTIYAALRNGRLSRSAISGLFQRHVSSPRIEQALTYLLQKGRVRMITEETEGRPIEYWERVP